MIAALAFLTCLAAGCKKLKPLTPAERNAMVDRRIAEEAAAVRRLDALVAIPDLMDAIPPTISAAAFGPLTGKARLVDATFRMKDNVLCVMLEGLKTSPFVVQPSLPQPQGVDWHMARKFLGDVRAAKASGQNYGHLMQDLSPAARIDYVVVVRGKLTPPKLTTAKAFESGAFVGDAQVFAIGDKTEHLGGVPLAAMNSKDLLFKHQPGKQEEKAGEELNRDLSSQVFVHLCQQLAQHAGVEIPASYTVESVKKNGLPK